MKKCPKCGTILDDSKKKCYMCGADLTISVSVKDFSSNFDKKIGSTISKGSDNVFNNGKDIDVNSEDIVNEKDKNNGSFFSHSSSSRDFFHKEISRLNSGSKEKEEKEEKKEKKKKKGFSLFGKKKDKEDVEEKEEKKTKKEKSSKKDDNNGQVKKITYSTNPKIPKAMEQSIIEKQLDDLRKIESNETEEVEEEKEENVLKSSIIEQRKLEERKEEIPESFKSFNSFLEEDSKTGESESIFKSKSKEVSEEALEDAFSMFQTKEKEPKKKKKKSSNKEIDKVIEKEKIDTKDKDEEIEISYYDSDSSITQDDVSKITKKSNKPKINWGETLKSKFDIRRKDPAQMKEIGRMIFNSVALIIFIVIVVFAYFKFIKVDKKQELAGLQYSVSDYFDLSSSDSTYKYYIAKSSKNACSIKVSSGPTNNPDDYADNFFAQIKSMYEKENGAVVNISEMRINGNVWKNEKIVFVPTDGTSVKSEDLIARYSYAIMLYNTSFYQIAFANTEEDKECDLQINKFINSLEFVEDNV